ncbi:MAG: dihydroneopterin aldolase [Bacteroides sp.]|nr:dihydroneopterin aldolase [Bacteroides sp.]
MISYITLHNLHCYACHGVMPQERLVGNRYTVNLRLRADIGEAMQSDDVAHTVNYADVCRAVEQEMAIPSQLLEHVASRILHRLFREFPRVEAVELKLTKRNPPMGADVEAAGVEISMERSECRPTPAQSVTHNP